MKSLSLVLTIVLLSPNKSAVQNIYVTHNGIVSFFAEWSITDVDAVNKNANVELNTATNAVRFNLAMRDFGFVNKKMGRDAEEKYLETEKYTKADFKGKIISKVDYDKPGSYSVIAKGVLFIHGTSKEVTQKGTIVVGEKQIKLQAEFDLMLTDFNIETPRILGKKMTSENVHVKVNASLTRKTDLVLEKMK